MPSYTDFLKDPLGQRGVEPWVKEFVSLVLPADWKQVDVGKTAVPYTNEYRHVRQPLGVVIGGQKMQLGDYYIHLQAAREDRPITLAEATDIKDIFLGADMVAYQILLPRQVQTRLGPNSIHLWMRCYPIEKKFHVPTGRDETNMIERVEKHFTAKG